MKKQTNKQKHRGSQYISIEYKNYVGGVVCHVKSVLFVLPNVTSHKFASGEFTVCSNILCPKTLSLMIWKNSQKKTLMEEKNGSNRGGIPLPGQAHRCCVYRIKHKLQNKVMNRITKL